LLLVSWELYKTPRRPTAVRQRKRAPTGNPYPLLAIGQLGVI
jgi:hypothetical protein